MFCEKGTLKPCSNGAHCAKPSVARGAAQFAYRASAAPSHRSGAQDGPTSLLNGSCANEPLCMPCAPACSSVSRPLRRRCGPCSTGARTQAHARGGEEGRPAHQLHRRAKVRERQAALRTRRRLAGGQRAGAAGEQATTEEAVLRVAEARQRARRRQLLARRQRAKAGVEQCVAAAGRVADKLQAGRAVRRQHVRLAVRQPRAARLPAPLRLGLRRGARGSAGLPAHAGRPAGAQARGRAHTWTAFCSLALPGCRKSASVWPCSFSSDSSSAAAATCLASFFPRPCARAGRRKPRRRRGAAQRSSATRGRAAARAPGRRAPGHCRRRTARRRRPTSAWPPR